MGLAVVGRRICAKGLLGESSFFPQWIRAAQDEATFNPRKQIPEPEEHEY
jgi:hypothetical protein